VGQRKNQTVSAPPLVNLFPASVGALKRRAEISEDSVALKIFNNVIAKLIEGKHEFYNMLAANKLLKEKLDREIMRIIAK
jgi:hypothetical protein